MNRLPLILAALTLVHSACLDLITVIPDDFEVVSVAPDAGQAVPDAGATAGDTGAGRDAGARADGGGQPPVRDAGAPPDAGGCVAQVEACGDGLDNDCDGSTDEEDCTRVYEPNPACHEEDAYRQHMTLCMRFEGNLDNEVRDPSTVLGHGDGESNYVLAGEEDAALRFDGTLFVSIPVVETPEYVNDEEGMPTQGQAYTRSVTLAARLQPSLAASHTLFSAHNDWDMDSEPSGPLDVKIVEGRVRVNAYYQDADMTIQSVSVSTEPLPENRYSHVIVRLGQDPLNPNSKRLLGIWVEGERVAYGLPWTAMYPRNEETENIYDLIGGTNGIEEDELSAEQLYRGELADLRVWNTAQPDGLLALEVGRWVDTFGGGRSEAWTCGLSDRMAVRNIGDSYRGRVPANSSCTRTLFERAQPVRRVAWTVACASDCGVSNQTQRRHRVQLLPGAEAAISVAYGDATVQLFVGEEAVTESGTLDACRFEVTGGTRQRAPELRMAFDWGLRKGALTCDGLDNPVTFDLPEGLTGLEGVTLSTNSPFDLERFEWRLAD